MASAIDRADNILAASMQWSELPLHILESELRRRQDDGETKPECGTKGAAGDYNTPVHVFALVLILALSTGACAFPILARRFPRLPVPRRFLFLSRHFGTGVLIATAFVHLLPTAFVSMTHPCLPDFWNKTYPAMPGLIAMASVLLVVGIEMFFAMRGAGHVHGSEYDRLGGDNDGGETSRVGGRKVGAGHGHWQRTGGYESLDGVERQDGDLEEEHKVERVAFLGNASGREEQRVWAQDESRRSAGGATTGPAEANGRDDATPARLLPSTSPLPPDVDTASPLPESSDESDGASDLGLDLEELDPIGNANNHSSRAGAKPFSPRTPRSARSPATAAAADASSSSPITSDTANAAALERRLLLQCLLLEAGILFHSVFIGIALSVSTGPPFVVLLVAISFHQTFEGLALGARIASVPQGALSPSSPKPWLMALAYGATTPLGQAIGLAVHNLYDPRGQTGLLMVGAMNAVSAGLLLFAGLVELLAEDFLSERSYADLRGRRRKEACAAVVLGALLMAFVGAFA